MGNMTDVAGRWFVLIGVITASVIAGPPCNDGLLFTNYRLDVGEEPRSLAIGDLDGDGMLDLAVANGTSDDLSILLGNSDGTFQTESRIGVGSAPRSVAIGDLDGDSIPDLAVANFGSDDVSVLLGNSNGTFQTDQRIGIGGSSTSIAIEDFDGDGSPDLSVVSSANVYVLLGNGDGTFQAAQLFGVGSNSNAIAIGDLNGDGSPDFAVTNDFSSDLSILLGNGDGTFQGEQRFDVGGTANSVAIGDFNSDDAPDLAVAISGSDEVSIVLGNGDGTFQTPQRFGVGDFPISVAVDDLNSDGTPDLALANFSSNDVSVLLGNGDGSFQSEQRFNVGDELFSVASGDLDGDGIPDLAVTNRNRDDVSVLLGNGDGTFRTEPRFGVGDSPGSIGIGDFNGDGAYDLAIANGGIDEVSILLGNSDGTFQPEQRFCVGGVPGSVAVGDLNGNGVLDLAVANIGSDEVSILLGNGDGTFQAEMDFDTGNTPVFVMISDLNGDEVPDLAVANLFSDQVSILLGNGDGTFQAEQRFAVGNQPQSVAIDDLDADGVRDLAVANRLNDEVSILLGNGDGTFQAQLRFGTGDEPGYVVIGDLNGDGEPDLAVTNNNSDDVSILLGNGDGIFKAEQRFSVGIFPSSVAIGDLDLDGVPDVSVANSFSNDVSILIGNGDGTFQNEQRYDAGTRPESIAIGDFDLDGVNDLAVVNNESDDLSVLVNNTLATSFWIGGGQAFSSATNWQGGVVPSLLAPNIAVFDDSVGGYGPITDVVMTDDVELLSFQHSSAEVQLNLNGYDLQLLGDAAGNTPPLWLDLAAEQCNAMVPPPTVAPLLRLDNNNSMMSDATFMTGNATIGRVGPATLEIDGDNGIARLDVREVLRVGAAGDGTIRLRTDQSELFYGNAGSTTDAVIIGESATGTVRVEAGQVFAVGSVPLVLGMNDNSEGRMQIDGTSALWTHTGDMMTVGRLGTGTISITNGGRLNSEVTNIVLAEQPGSLANVLVSGADSLWIDPFGVMVVGDGGGAVVTLEDGGEIDVFGGLTISSSGRLEGSGTTSEVVNFGDIIVGNSGTKRGAGPAMLTINGDYDQFDDPTNPEFSGRILIDLFETGGTISSDLLSVSGDAALAGGLFIDSGGIALDPSGSQPLNVLQAGSLSGRFDVAFLPGVTPDAQGDGRFLRVQYPLPVALGSGTVSLIVDTLSGAIDTDSADSFTVNGQPVSAAVGMLNDDDLPDLAFVVPGDNGPGSAIVLYNAGFDVSGVWQGFSGSFAIDVGENPSAIAIGNADLSNGNDFAVANRDLNNVMIFTNDGIGGFGTAPTQTIPVGDAPSSITFGELDEDKWDDLITVNFNDGTVTYVDNTDGGTIFAMPVALLAGSGPSEAGIDDLDGDGMNDVFTTNSTGDSVSIILGNGNSTFEPVVNLPLAGNPRSIAAVDLDDDLDLDLAIIAQDLMGSANTIRVLRNDLTDGQLIFSEDQPLDSGGVPLFVLAGDVDQDGQGDLVTVNSAGGARSESESSRGETPEPMAVGVVRQTAASSFCSGDCDDSGEVNFADLVSMLFEFGTPGASPGCDADQSGSVNFADLVTALFEFGPCP